MKNDDYTSKSFSRRDFLGILGTGAAAVMFSCNSANRASVPETSLPPCVGVLEQTEGPFFVDEKLNRSDIRTNSATGAASEGTTLEIEFQVSEIGAGGVCRPLPDATVDIWHCDALGAYSDVRDRSSDTTGQDFLRGFQTTDKRGVTLFTTIFPGWYPGRTVHIHFKIRTKNNADFTSQLYFDDALTDKIHAQNPYAAKGRRNLRNDRDGIFRDGGEALTLRLNETANGYRAVFQIGLQS